MSLGGKRTRGNKSKKIKIKNEMTRGCPHVENLLGTVLQALGMSQLTKDLEK